MKKIIFACGVIAAISCQKSVTDKSNPNPITSETESSAILHRNTKFGSSVAGNFNGDESVGILNSLNAKYVRHAIVISQWKGKSNIYDTYVRNGVNVILNVNNVPLTRPAPFSTDIKTYREKLNEITDKYKPEVLVVENEEINKHYHYGSLKDYLRMVKAAIKICHSKGIKVTNGGIYGPQLEVLTYRYLQTKSQARADSFASHCMTKSQIKSAQTPGRDEDLEFKIRQLDTLLHFYKNNSIDYVNVHLYEPFNPNIDPQTVRSATPFVVAGIQECLMAKTGKPVMTNETTPRNNSSPELVTSILNQYDQLNFPYVLWYSNDTERGNRALYNLNTGKLNENGIAYSDFMSRY